MEKLKPCPFCGEKNIDVTNKEEGWSIKCLSCHVSIDDYISREAAMEAWNRRPKRHQYQRKAIPQGDAKRRAGAI